MTSPSSPPTSPSAPTMRHRPELAAVLDAAPDAMLVVDGTGQIVAANALAAKLFGKSIDTFVGEPIEVVVPHRMRSVHRSHREGYTEHAVARPMGSRLSLTAVRADGSEFPVEVSLGPVTIDDATYIVAAVRDLSVPDRERMRLEALHDMTQALFENRDLAENVAYLADRARRVTGADVAAIWLPFEGATMAVVDIDENDERGDVSPASWTFGPYLCVPLLCDGQSCGRLAVANRAGGPALTPADLTFLRLFAAQAASVIDFVQLRADVAASHRGRAYPLPPGTELHDSIIQSLFGVAMRLRATETEAHEPERVRTGLGSALDHLDAVIEEVRGHLTSGD